MATVLGAAACSTERDAGGQLQSPSISRTDGVFGRIPSIVDEVSPSVVAVNVAVAAGRAAGSGVIWDEDGLIVTNDHVVSPDGSISVAFASGERTPARVRARDPFTDIAVLEVERSDLPVPTYADAVPEVGELAVAIGNPLNFDNTISAGVVSGLHRSIPSGGRTPALVDLIQTDAAISPGSSGGALVGSDGRVLGINVAYLPPQTGAVAIGFAIPSPTVRDVVEQLLRRGEAEHAFLGVGLAPLTPAIAQRFDLETSEGAIVLNVLEGSAAAEAGIRQGDIIVRIARERVVRVEDVYSALRGADPGETMPVTVLRDGEEESFSVRLQDRPSR